MYTTDKAGKQNLHVIFREYSEIITDSRKECEGITSFNLVRQLYLT